MPINEDKHQVWTNYRIFFWFELIIQNRNKNCFFIINFLNVCGTLLHQGKNPKK